VDSLLAISGKDEKTSEIILKVLNPGTSAASMQINLKGVSSISGGTSTILASANIADENSFGQPTKIVPVAKPLSGLSPQFKHEFPPHSLSILRLKAR